MSRLTGTPGTLLMNENTPGFAGKTSHFKSMVHFQTVDIIIDKNKVFTFTDTRSSFGLNTRNTELLTLCESQSVHCNF